jgi:hypothetical protein
MKTGSGSWLSFSAVVFVCLQSCSGSTRNDLRSGADETLFDQAFGIWSGRGRLPVGMPLSNAAVSSSKEDLPGDGQDPVMVRGFGVEASAF